MQRIKYRGSVDAFYLLQSAVTLDWRADADKKSDRLLTGITGEKRDSSLNRPQWKRLSWFKAGIFVVDKVKSTFMTKADGGFVFSKGQGVE